VANGQVGEMRLRLHHRQQGDSDESLEWHWRNLHRALLNAHQPTIRTIVVHIAFPIGC
jgi:hypothetical protein